MTKPRRSFGSEKERSGLTGTAASEKPARGSADSSTESSVLGWTWRFHVERATRDHAPSARSDVIVGVIDLIVGVPDLAGDYAGPRGKRITKVVVPPSERASSVPPCEITIWRAM